MKKQLFFLISLFSMALMAQTGTKTLYDFSLKTIDGKPYPLSNLKGKKVLLVNTASECGYTPQYEGLEKLYRQYKDKNFVIIGIPSNDFGGQEPGDNAAIKAFCSKNYGVSFPMMEKIKVSGKDKHPLYNWLADKNQNGVLDGSVKWNFHKFLIDKNGKLVKSLGSSVKPDSKEISDWINN